MEKSARGILDKELKKEMRLKCGYSKQDVALLECIEEDLLLRDTYRYYLEQYIYQKVVLENEVKRLRKLEGLENENKY